MSYGTPSGVGWCSCLVESLATADSRSPWVGSVSRRAVCGGHAPDEERGYESPVTCWYGTSPRTPEAPLGRDVTYVVTAAGWAYTAFVQDLFSRAVVGRQVADHLGADLALDTLDLILSP
ncbi:hypothetical protein [Sphaerisporangium fuscum]|uniref:hypothetical protein n=1 Tax=Sphaerisporangium fuscum TaxID=2835868 RepID=UPI001BDCBDA1|nr:hypothetical protein [Sphaerisporangium fuscum]